MARNSAYRCTYSAWRNARERCENPLHPKYRNYGARGINFCIRWQEFSNFLADMGLRPSDAYVLDRIDNNRGYSKENCRWLYFTKSLLNRRPSRVAKFGVIPGVRWNERRGKYIADAKSQVLYEGYDLFEAVCVRRSWEAQHLPKGTL